MYEYEHDEETGEVYAVYLPNGDNAGAETLGGALLASATMVEEAAFGYGIARRIREEVVITRGGIYDGRATQLAREGSRA